MKTMPTISLLCSAEHKITAAALLEFMKEFAGNNREKGTPMKMHAYRSVTYTTRCVTALHVPCAGLPLHEWSVLTALRNIFLSFLVTLSFYPTLQALGCKTPHNRPASPACLCAVRAGLAKDRAVKLHKPAAKQLAYFSLPGSIRSTLLAPSSLRCSSSGKR